jgi:uncharacterized membrane protein HdeD (DUF308 family)
MAQPSTSPEKLRRLAGVLFLVVGLVDLVLGAIAGALITLVVGVGMLVVGGALLASALGTSGRSGNPGGGPGG